MAISVTDRPIDFAFDPSRVFGDGGSIGPTSGCIKSKIGMQLLMTSSRNNLYRNFGAKCLGNEAR